MALIGTADKIRFAAAIFRRPPPRFKLFLTSPCFVLQKPQTLAMRPMSTVLRPLLPSDGAQYRLVLSLKLNFSLAVADCETESYAMFRPRISSRGQPPNLEKPPPPEFLLMSLSLNNSLPVTLRNRNYSINIV